MEKCTNCERSIGKLEQAYIYQNQHVVCGECYVLLIGEKTHTPTTKTEEKSTIYTINKADIVNQMICVNCGCIGKPKNITKGSFWIELILWLSFFVPGLIYSIWRLTTRYWACPKCKAPNMISLYTPRGQQLLEEYGQKIR
jgi:hypothetical protein